MTDKYKVSIIIPVFHVEKYIFQCLQSVANQTMAEGVECILVDDCGKDHSVNIANDFILSYQGNIEFRLLHHEQNRGLSAARNSGIQASRGEYLFFLDSDDEITVDCISRLFALAEKYHAELVQGTYLGNHQVLSKFCNLMPEFTSNIKYIKKTMLDYDRFPVMAQNRLVLRSVIMNNNLFFKEGIIHEDNHWTFFLAKYIKTLAICSTPSYYYRITPGSITNKIDINKECNSYSFILNDFCEHFDSLLLGDQKHSALKILKTVLHFQNDYKERVVLFNGLYNKCNVVEKTALLCWFKTKDNCVFKSKLFNICIRIFYMTN